MVMIFKKIYLWILLLVFVSLLEFGVFDSFVHLLVSKYYFFKGERTVESSFVHIQIPTNWFIAYEDEMKLKLIGPPINKYTDQFMTSYKDENESMKNYFYFEPKFCRSKLEEIPIENEILFHDGNKTYKNQFESSIVFCEKPDFDEPYTALFNKGTMSVIVIKPYLKENQETYVKLFKSLKFDAYIEELPLWLKE